MRSFVQHIAVLFLASSVTAKESSFELRSRALQNLPVEHPTYSRLDDWQIEEADRWNDMPSGAYEPEVIVDTKLRPREVKAVAEFRQWTVDNDLHVPPGWFTDERHDLRILVMTQRDFQKTYDYLIQADKRFRSVASKISKIDSPNDPVLKSLETGWAYCLGRDRDMHPIVVYNFKKLLDTGIDYDLAEDVHDTLAYYVQEFGTQPGKVERWNTIVDLKDVGLLDLPIYFISQWAKSTKTGFHSRLKSMTLINAPRWLEYAAQIIYTFTDEFGKQKIHILGVGKDNRKFMTDNLGVENLEKRYGGKLPNKKSGFFPPEFEAVAPVTPEYLQEKPSARNDTELLNPDL